MASKLLRPSSVWQRLAYLAASALALGLCMCFPTAVGAVIEWIAFIPAALVLYSLVEKPRRAYLYGFFFFYVMYFVVWHWVLSLYPMDFVGMSNAASAAVVALAWLGLPMLAAIAGGFVFLVFARLGKGCHCALLPFLAAALWAVFEWSQTLTWAGVPWGRLALGQLVGNFTLTAMSASLLGSYFVSALIIATASLVAQALLLGKIKWRVITAASLVLGNLLCGVLLVSVPMGEESIKVAAVQGNISSREGYTAYTNSQIWERYEKYTRLAAADGAKIVLWPESVFSARFLSSDKALQRDLSSLAVDCGITLSIGCFSYGDDGEILNCIATFYPDGSSEDELYSKRRLVPFGEYMPWRTFLSFAFPPLAEIASLEEDIIAGSSTAIADGGGVALGGIICFDSIYEPLARDSVRDGAELLLLSTNDSWFGTSRALYMHVAQARLRAIENSRGVLRSASTGISCVISPTGAINASLGAGEEGYAISEVMLSTRNTPYTLTGNIFVYISLAFVLSIGAFSVYKSVSRRRRVRDAKFHLCS